MTTTRYDCAEVPDEWLRDPGSDRTLCSAPPPPVVGGVDNNLTWTGWPAACSPPATGPSWRQRCAGRRRRCRRRGETRGGGREARGIPGRGEEDGYGGRKVQGGVDRGGRQRWRLGPGRGPGGRGRARARRATRWPRTGRPCGGCPPVAFQRGDPPRPLSIVAYP
jgi:hypothetical protein